MQGIFPGCEDTNEYMHAGVDRREKFIDSETPPAAGSSMSGVPPSTSNLNITPASSSPKAMGRRKGAEEPEKKDDSSMASYHIRDVERLTLVYDDRTDKTFSNRQHLNYDAFRIMAPYIAMHRGHTVVIHIPGEIMMKLEKLDEDSFYREDDGYDVLDDVPAPDDRFSSNFPSEDLEYSMERQRLTREIALATMRDVLLLKTLGVKPVLVAGCRPQIRKKLEEEGIRSFFANGSRVCDRETLLHCQSVAGHVRFQIESVLSRGLTNSPMDMGTTPVVSGNFVKAIPFGVRNGIDYKFTGIVQKLTNAERMNELLDEGFIVLLSHLGYSPSGEVFHCRSEDVAVCAAAQLKASKLIFLHNGEVVFDEKRRGARGSLVHNLPLSLAHMFEEKIRGQLGSNIEKLRHSDTDSSSDQWKLQFLDYLQGSIAACKQGVRRVHMVSRYREGAIIEELYTREGSGIMVTQDVYEGVRPAKTEDVQAILNLIRPLEHQGILVTRPPEQVESEINKFIVFERDGEVLACCQLVHYEDERFEGGSAEMCCVAVAESQRGSSLGSALLSYCMRSCALELGCTELFVLTTRSQHWFTDRGFVEATPERLPPNKRSVYSYKRKPKIYFKHISSEREADEYDLQFHD